MWHAGPPAPCTRSAAVSALPPAPATCSRTKARTPASASTPASIVIVSGAVSAGASAWRSGIAAGRVSGHPGEVGRGPLDELAVTPAPGERAVADDDRAPAQDDVRPAADLTTLVARIVDVHVVGLRADRAGRVRVVDDEIGIRSDRDRALPREHPEQLGGCGGDDLDPALLRDPAVGDAAVVEQVDAVLDPRQPVRNLPEIALAEVLLAFEVERAVVGRDELEVVLHEPGPELRLVIGGPERRRAHELRAVEAALHVLERQEQGLRARLGECLRPAVARGADRVEGLPGGGMDDVDRNAGGLGQGGEAGRR